LPDELIIGDVEKTLNTYNNRTITFEETGTTYCVPVGAAHVIVGRGAFARITEMGIGDRFEVLVAVGGLDLERTEFGFVLPKYFFAEIWYSPQAKMVSIDFNQA